MRPAELHEYEAIGRLTVEAYGEHRSRIPGRFRRAYEEELAGVAERAERGATVLVAEEDGRIRGAASLVPSSRDVSLVYLRYVAVDPAVRRRGIGRSLTKAAMEEARALGFRTMRWQTAEFMDPARRLYESLGFEPVAEPSRAAPHITVYWYQVDLEGR